LRSTPSAPPAAGSASSRPETSSPPAAGSPPISLISLQLRLPQEARPLGRTPAPPLPLPKGVDTVYPLILPRRSAQIGGARRRSVEIVGGRRRSVEIGGDRWRSAEIGGGRWRSVEIGGDRRRSAGALRRGRVACRLPPRSGAGVWRVACGVWRGPSHRVFSRTTPY
jgi:hypothetical protein